MSEQKPREFWVKTYPGGKHTGACTVKKPKKFPAIHVIEKSAYDRAVAEVDRYKELYEDYSQEVEELQHERKQLRAEVERLKESRDHDLLMNGVNFIEKSAYDRVCKERDALLKSVEENIPTTKKMLEVAQAVADERDQLRAEVERLKELDAYALDDSRKDHAIMAELEHENAKFKALVELASESMDHISERILYVDTAQMRRHCLDFIDAFRLAKKRDGK